MTLPILQFGTGRFLQAHMDFFVSEALKRNEALGRIAVVQTSDSPQGKARAAAFNRQVGFPVHIRGLQNGQPVDRVVTVDSVGHASIAADDWPKVVERLVAETKVVVSNCWNSSRRPARKGHSLASPRWCRAGRAVSCRLARPSVAWGEPARLRIR